MNKNEIMTKMTRGLSRFGLKIKKHSPEILVVTGVVGVVASTVMACKATTKVNDILETHKDTVEKIHKVSADPEYKDEYSEEDAKKDLTITYTKTTMEFVKLYAPAVILGVASLTCIISSNRIMHKRNAALAAAYAAVDKGFKNYRKNVVDRFGEDIDKELRFNVKPREVEEIVTDEEGNETVVKTTANTVDPTMKSPYAICFDETCAGWSKSAEANKFFLLQQQNYANDKLKAQGHLFLNDVYELIGAQKTKAGQIVGWVYDEKNPIGDNYVDFGIFELHDEQKRNFVNGFERSIWLDFNVDGNILDMI